MLFNHVLTTIFPTITIVSHGPPSEALSIGRESEMTRATTLEVLDEVAANAL